MTRSGFPLCDGRSARVVVVRGGLGWSKIAPVRGSLRQPEVRVADLGWEAR